MPATVYRFKEMMDLPGELEGLFREHANRILRTAYRLTGNLGDAEDVLQTIFLRLLRRESPLDLSGAPERYLQRAAINASLDLLRERGNRPALSLEEGGIDSLQSPDRGPESIRRDRELRRRIQHSVSKLGSRAGEMFALRYFEGFDNREIARMLGTTQMVVAVTLHRARASVRRDLGKFLEAGHEEFETRT